MGAWGIGLYQNDFALDLRSTVKSVARLPFEPDELLELLRSSAPGTADDATDEDHTIFWLVVADQFAKRGIDCPRARDHALTIVADGTDIEMMGALGMDEADLAKRRKTLEALRERIAAPIETGKTRQVLKAPQKLLLGVGEVLIYPVCKREPINPYTVGKEWASVKAWKQDGWGALVVTERGRVFDFLAWYRPLVIGDPLPLEPTLAELIEPRPWLLQHPGTLSARHYTNLQLKSLGCFSVDATRLALFFPDRLSAKRRVVDDISLANSMSVERPGPPRVVRPAGSALGYPPTPLIDTLADIVDLPGADASPGRPGSAVANLSGEWRGTFYYADDAKPPGSFIAKLSECDRRLTGEIRDDTGTLESRPTFAIVEGARLRREVRFFKRYVSEGSKKYVPIQYVGETDDTTTRIAGRWFIPRHSTGTFVMTRLNPSSDD